MKKNLKKLMIAAAAVSVLMGCANGAKTNETKETVAESVDAKEAGMSIEANTDMPTDMRQAVKAQPVRMNRKFRMRLIYYLIIWE